MLENCDESTPSYSWFPGVVSNCCVPRPYEKAS